MKINIATVDGDVTSKTFTEVEGPGGSYAFLQALKSSTNFINVHEPNGARDVDKLIRLEHIVSIVVFADEA